MTTPLATLVDHLDELAARGHFVWGERDHHSAPEACDFCRALNNLCSVEIEHLPGVCTCLVADRPGPEDVCAERVYSLMCVECEAALGYAVPHQATCALCWFNREGDFARDEFGDIPRALSKGIHRMLRMETMRDERTKVGLALTAALDAPWWRHDLTQEVADRLADAAEFIAVWRGTASGPPMRPRVIAYLASIGQLRPAADPPPNTYEWPDRETWEATLGSCDRPSVSLIAADRCTPDEIEAELAELRSEIRDLEEQIEAARVELRDRFGIDVDALRDAAIERDFWDDDVPRQSWGLAQDLGFLEERHNSLVWAGRRLLVDGLVPNTIQGYGRPEYLERHPVLARFYAAQVEAFHTPESEKANTDVAWEAELSARARTEAWLAS